MSIHVWLMIAIIIIASLYNVLNRSRTGRKHCVQCLTVILTCFSGFRSWQMGDVFHYCYAYLKCIDDSWVLDLTSGDTIGLQLFFRLAGKLNIGFEVCLFIIAAFSAITLGILIFRYSNSLLLSYMLYLGLGNYIFTLSGLKQTIAMSFITLAVIAIFEKKPAAFLIWTLFAGLFHLPALVFLPAYLIARKKINLYYLISLLLVVYLMYRFRGQIVSSLTSLYYDGELEFGASEAIGGKFIMMIVILMVSAIIRPVQNYDHIYRYLFNLMVAATVIQSASVYDNVFTRLSDYYFQFFIIFVTYVLEPGYSQAKHYPNYVRRIRYWPQQYYTVGVLIVFIGTILFYMRILDGNALLLKDFHFFWEVNAPVPMGPPSLIGG